MCAESVRLRAGYGLPSTQTALIATSALSSEVVAGYWMKISPALLAVNSTGV